MGVVAATRAGRLSRERSDWQALAERTDKRISLAMYLAHVMGAVDVFVLLFWILPTPEGSDPRQYLVPNLIALAIYFPLATILAKTMARKFSARSMAWIREQRPPTAEERDDVIRTPMKCLRLDGALWAGGAILFTLVNLGDSFDAAVHVGATVALGGITVCAVAYLLSETYGAPLTELALSFGPPANPQWPGVEGRVVLAWITVTGVPIIGLLMVGLHGVADPGITTEQVSRAVLALGAVALVFGLGTMILVARTISTPLTGLRKALARVQGGDLTSEVRISDASEVGVLQSGFNAMVSGLRERDRMQDLFSKQVGEDVAKAALETDPRLGGDTADVAVLFIDMVGSTSWAADMPPEQVVARLNRFFAIVVDEVERHGGWVNKFEGDAALCVFGAPADVEDAAACAMKCGRALRDRIARELPGVQAGIGLSAGPVVAGWVGAERRFEYTVIGDAVNEAARLCELAKRRPELILASCAILDRAGTDEHARWRVDGEELLRGRTRPTQLAIPA